MDLKAIMAGSSKAQDQNLINPPKINTNERKAGYYKSIVLDVLSVLSAALFGFFYYRYLTERSSIWLLVASLILFALFSVFQVFLLSKPKRSAAIILVEAAAVVIWFWQDANIILVITFLVLLALLLWGHFAARTQIGNSIEIPFFGASGNVLGKFTTGILLFMILAYVPQLNSGNALVVSPQSFRTFFDWTAELVNRYYPNLDFNGSFGNFSESFTKMELANNPNFQSLNTTEQSTTVEQSSQQFATAFSQPASTTIATTTPTSDAFYNVLNGILSAWHSQNSGWFVIGWITVVFIGLRVVGILFVWLMQFLALIFYEILLASGYMKIVEENHTHQVITY